MRFLVIQHIAVEHPGSFREFMTRKGVSWDAVALNEGQPIPDLRGYDALLVFGGPMDVWEEREHPWLIPEKMAIRAFVNDYRKPFLGVCLGHQLLAHALGGSVGRMTKPEVGVTRLSLTDAGRSDPLFQGLAEPIMVVQWHSAEVKSLPTGAVHLAQTDACLIQALRVHEHAYGLQCHVELEDETIGEWNHVPAYASALRQVLGADAHATFQKRAAAHMPEFLEAAQNLFYRFCALAESSSG